MRDTTSAARIVSAVRPLVDSIKPFKNEHLCPYPDVSLPLERAFRAKVRLHGDTIQAARFADLAIRAMRLRFSHVDGCDQCLLAELEVLTK